MPDEDGRADPEYRRDRARCPKSRDDFDRIVGDEIPKNEQGRNDDEVRARLRLQAVNTALAEIRSRT